MSAGKQLARSQRSVAVALASIESAKADGYKTNHGYEGGGHPPEGEVTDSTGQSLTRNEWLIELETEILQQCKGIDAAVGLLLIYCSRAPGGMDPRAFEKMRCSGGEGPWAEPTCERYRIGERGTDHPYPHICDACDQRRRHYLKDPEGYEPRVARRASA